MIKTFEKFNINPIQINDLPKLNLYSYVLWLDTVYDTKSFAQETNTEDSIAIISMNGDKFIYLIVLSNEEFISYAKIIKSYPHDTFISKLDKEMTIKYLEKQTYSHMYWLLDDEQDEYLTHLHSNSLLEKMHINPIQISDLPNIEYETYVIFPIKYSFDDIDMILNILHVSESNVIYLRHNDTGVLETGIIINKDKFKKYENALFNGFTIICFGSMFSIDALTKYLNTIYFEHIDDIYCGKITDEYLQLY